MRDDGRDSRAPEDAEVAEILDDLEELEADADDNNERRSIRRAILALGRASGGRIFGFDDVAQQIVGGFVLSAPFVVTEEVWALAEGMGWIQWAITVFMVVVIGYGTLYRADHDRDAEQEEAIAGLPLRFVSLIVISYSSVAILALVFDAPETFAAGWAATVRAVSIGAIFSVVGAATADSLF